MKKRKLTPKNLLPTYLIGPRPSVKVRLKLWPLTSWVILKINEEMWWRAQ